MNRYMIAAALIGVAGVATAAAVEPEAVKYVDGAIEQSLSGAPGDPVAGEKVYGSRSIGNCVACHAVSKMTDVAWHGDVGPSLDGVADRWSEAELRGIVANAKITFDGTVMPAFYKTGPYVRPGDAFTGKAAKEISPLLTAQQVEDVVAFLMTLKDE